MHGRGETGHPLENPPISGIVRHDPQMRKSAATPPGIEPGSPYMGTEVGFSGCSRFFHPCSHFTDTVPASYDCHYQPLHATVWDCAIDIGDINLTICVRSNWNTCRGANQGSGELASEPASPEDSQLEVIKSAIPLCQHRQPAGPCSPPDVLPPPKPPSHPITPLPLLFCSGPDGRVHVRVRFETLIGCHDNVHILRAGLSLVSHSPHVTLKNRKGMGQQLLAMPSTRWRKMILQTTNSLALSAFPNDRPAARRHLLRQVRARVSRVELGHRGEQKYAVGWRMRTRAPESLPRRVRKEWTQPSNQQQLHRRSYTQSGAACASKMASPDQQHIGTLVTYLPTSSLAAANQTQDPFLEPRAANQRMSIVCVRRRNILKVEPWQASEKCEVAENGLSCSLRNKTLCRPAAVDEPPLQIMALAVVVLGACRPSGVPTPFPLPPHRQGEGADLKPAGPPRNACFGPLDNGAAKENAAAAGQLRGGSLCDQQQHKCQLLQLVCGPHRLVLPGEGEGVVLIGGRARIEAGPESPSRTARVAVKTTSQPASTPCRRHRLVEKCFSGPRDTPSSSRRAVKAVPSPGAGGRGGIWRDSKPLPAPEWRSSCRQHSPQTHPGVYDAKPRRSSLRITTTLGIRLAAANQFRFPAETLPNFRVWETYRTIPLVGGLSQGCPVSPPPPATAIRRCAYPPRYYYLNYAKSY
ncbi:hypothetical protein PR048_019190 [Dryococelus australis]|uniref:Uncharacterized protein n=1 Tax=Dryococelus australis TaxID=614101 RepID=A0ABQ9H2S7_9NEOP|nr:hypothetical protein PR048_019190 [Dryococelus australis]